MDKENGGGGSRQPLSGGADENAKQAKTVAALEARMATFDEERAQLHLELAKVCRATERGQPAPSRCGTSCSCLTCGLLDRVNTQS